MKNLKYLLILLLLIPTLVSADTGPKPTIVVKLKNIEGTDYLIDLMSDFKDKQDEIDKIVERYGDYQERPIYQYHEDTWYATALRDWLLWGDLNGNEEHVHTFTYFGVPEEFKVIIELPDGTIKTTEKIVKTSFDFEVEVDVVDMTVVNKTGTVKSYLKYAGILLATIAIELLIAVLFKIKKYGLIIVTNIATNICLQALMILAELNLIGFILAEIAVIGIEGIVYLSNLKLKKKTIVLYTVVANVITAILTFLI